MKPCDCGAELESLCRKLRLAELELAQEHKRLAAVATAADRWREEYEKATAWVDRLVKLRSQMTWAPGMQCSCQVCLAVDAVKPDDKPKGRIVNA